MKHRWMNAIKPKSPQAHRALGGLLLLFSACVLGPGCTMFRASQPAPAQAPVPATAPALAASPGQGKTGSADYMSKTVVREEEGGGAVENVILLNQKLTYTQEKLAALQADNARLSQQTTRQADEVQRLRTELALAQKELADANDLLKEMRQGLDKWKADVLGFRDEMRSAQKAQLDAMAKVLTLLTGDTPPAQAAPAPPPPAGSAPAKGASSAPSK